MQTLLREVLDPLSGDRHDVAVCHGFRAADRAERRQLELDGRGWWLLPGLYDPDAHMPLLLTGPRQYDLFAALHGGVVHTSVALPFQLLRSAPFSDITEEMDRVTLPRLSPVLSVLPDDESREFAPWLGRHSEELSAHVRVCKLYSADSHFRNNLDAVWQAGLTPAVYCSTLDDLEHLLGYAQAPLHFRHATSADAVKAMRTIEGATIQTSPHFLLPIDAEWSEGLTVLPRPPGNPQRSSLAAIVMEEVDILGSDHVSPAPSPPGGPGLQTQHHFLQALLAATRLYDWGLRDVLSKVADPAAKVMGTALDNSFLVVDPVAPQTVDRFPQQTPDRAPYIGLDLRGRVIAIGRDDFAVML